MGYDYFSKKTIRNSGPTTFILFLLFLLKFEFYQGMLPFKVTEELGELSVDRYVASVVDDTFGCSSGGKSATELDVCLKMIKQSHLFDFKIRYNFIYFQWYQIKKFIDMKEGHIER